ncbi:hypothetical protein M405DRAFT_844605 [Rhizopogon salebrosus TDB-379]|nr:hypothetical protein M405DRAFT_844605 [Rhizopogon salebrosus TDB-379]
MPKNSNRRVHFATVTDHSGETSSSSDNRLSRAEAAQVDAEMSSDPELFQLLDCDCERESELSDKDVPAMMDMISAYDRYNDGIELPNVLDQILMTMMTTARSMGWVKWQELHPLNLGFDQEVLPAHTSASRFALLPLNLGFDEGGVATKDLGDGGTLPAAGTAALHPLNLGFGTLPPLNLGFDEGGVTAKDLGDGGTLPAAGTVALHPLNLGFGTLPAAGTEALCPLNLGFGTLPAAGTEALRPLNLGFDQEVLPANESAGTVALCPINLGFHENVPTNNTGGGVAWPALHLGFDRPAGAQTMPPLNLGFDEENVLPTEWPVPRPLNLGFDEEHVPAGSAENQPLPAVNEESTVPTTDVWTRAHVTIQRAIDRLVALELEQALEGHPASQSVWNQIHACRQMLALYRQIHLNRQVRFGMNRTLHCLRKIGLGHLTE